MVAQPVPAGKADVERLSEIDDDVVKSFTSWDDIQTYFASEGIAVSTGLEISDGFVLLDEGEKKRFVNVPLMIIDWRFFDGDFGEAVTFRFMTSEGGKFRGNDGSTGIYQQLKDLTKTREAEGHKAPTQACAVRKGFQESEYTIDKRDGHALERGEEIPSEFKSKASTFYLRF